MLSMSQLHGFNVVQQSPAQVGYFVAITQGSSGDNKAAKSLNGADWVEHALPATRWWSAVAHGTPGLVAVDSGGSGATALSDDGETWSGGSGMAFAAWNDITWDGTVYCAVRQGDTCATSPDGETWTPRSMPASRTWYRVAANESVICALLLNGEKLAYSNDHGETWTEITLPASALWGDMIWAGSYFIIVSQAATGIVLTSANGVDWTQKANAPYAYGVASDGTRLCTIGYALGYVNHCYTSDDDGATWTSRSLPSAAAWVGGIAWNGEVFCAVGANQSGSSTTTRAVYSSNGESWTEATLPVSAYWQDITSTLHL